jgi:hypothetical protein
MNADRWSTGLPMGDVRDPETVLDGTIAGLLLAARTVGWAVSAAGRHDQHPGVQAGHG